MSKNTDQEGKKTVYSFKAERIGPPPHKKICAYEGKSDGKRGRRTARQREREKASSLCSSASKKQLYYITVSGLGSSHAFKEEAHVPLHLKSHGRVGEDGDEAEAREKRQQERKGGEKSNEEQTTGVS